MVATGGLERFDLFLGHVDEERKISRVTPEAYYKLGEVENQRCYVARQTLGQLEEHKALGFELFYRGKLLREDERFGETHGQLKNGIRRSRECVALAVEG